LSGHDRLVSGRPLRARLSVCHDGGGDAAVSGLCPAIHAPNSTRIHPDDLAILFAEYDGRFFGGQVKETSDTTPLHFGLSKRMTISGGKTAHFADG
jgi:hypothetical protein